jgi:hypothetical protein
MAKLRMALFVLSDIFGGWFCLCVFDEGHRFIWIWKVFSY